MRHINNRKRLKNQGQNYNEVNQLKLRKKFMSLVIKVQNHFNKTFLRLHCLPEVLHFVLTHKSRLLTLHFKLLIPKHLTIYKATSISHQQVP